MSDKYGSVIFDMDGTLLKSTSEDLGWMHNAVKRVIKNDLGYTNVESLTDRELITLAGLDGFDAFEELCREIDIDGEKAWFLIAHSRALEKLKLVEENDLELCEGAREIINCLSKKDLKLGLVSNAPEDSVISVIEFFGFKKDFDYYRGISDVEDSLKHRKPEPFYVDIAKQELGRPKFILVGDSSADVEAAEKAGIDSVLIGEKKDQNISPTYRISRLQELKDLIK